MPRALVAGEGGGALLRQGPRAHVRARVRAAAAEAVGKLGEHAAPAVPALTKSLDEDWNRDVHLTAAEALRKLKT